MVDLDNFFGAKKIINTKSAKVQLQIFKKNAKLKIKNGDVKEALAIYSTAKNLAVEWDLKEEILDINNLVRLAQINGLQEIKNIYENEAKISLNKSRESKALEYYNNAFKAATEIFKLGVTEVEKDIKKYKKKIEELKRALEYQND